MKEEERIDMRCAEEKRKYLKGVRHVQERWRGDENRQRSFVKLIMNTYY